jgi:hypothetical protein
MFKNLNIYKLVWPKEIPNISLFRTETGRDLLLLVYFKKLENDKTHQEVYIFLIHYLCEQENKGDIVRTW